MQDVTLWGHQKKAIERATNATEFALLFEPGLGKTLTAITILKNRYNYYRRIIPTLIISPLITLHNWKDEWCKYSKVNPDCVVVLVGHTSKRVQLLAKKITSYKSEIIVITNYEALATSPQLFDCIFKWNPEYIVFDESQRIKSYNSKRTKVVTRLCDRATFRLMLTGTPILNSPLDIFSQYRALDGGKTFGINFFEFRSRYFYDKNAGMPAHMHFPNWIIRENAFEAMNRLIYRKAERALKKDCLDLPPFVRQKVFVELSPLQLKMYKEMQEDLVTFINDKAFVADVAIVKMLKMVQIITGFINDGEGNATELPNPRNAALQELLEDLTPDHKVIVWACFHANYTQIKKVLDKLKIKYVEAHGLVSTPNKFHAVDAFNTDNNVRVFLGHPGSLGVGINLIQASYSIYYSRTHNLEHDIQSEARNYRGGSEIHEKITRIDILARDTIDEAILDCLEKKLTSSEKILSTIKEKIC